MKKTGVKKSRDTVPLNSLQNICFHSSVPLSLFMSVSVSVSMSCVGMDAYKQHWHAHSL